MSPLKLVLIAAFAPAIALADPQPRVRSPQADTNTQPGSATQAPQQQEDDQSNPAPFGLTVKAGASGLVVTDVDSGSPAASAGIKPGDVIKKIDSTPVADTGDLAHAWNADKLGSKPEASFEIVRDQKTMDVQADLDSAIP